MKTIYIFLCLMFVYAFSYSQWTTLNSGTTNNLTSVYFTNMNTGYVVGGNGTILKTINAGLSWTILNSDTSYHLLSVNFTDSNTGYAVGTNGTILKTTNAGSTWTPLTSGTVEDLYSVYFTNADTGIAVGEHELVLRTTNAGSSWSIIIYEPNPPLPAHSITYLSIFFTDENTGYVTGFEAQNLIKTTDGGITWFDIPCIPAFSIFFTDAYTGYIVDGEDVLKSVDEGNTWLPLGILNYESKRSVYFVNQNIGFVVGSNGTILKTINAGNSWTTSSSGTIFNLTSIYFTSLNTGYIVGNYGTILKTSIGGFFLNLDVINGGVNDTLYTSSYPVYVDAGVGYQSYLWNNGDTTQITQVNIDGWYSVTVSTGSKIIMTDSIYVKLITQIYQNELTEKVIVYPNPNNGQIFIDFSLSDSFNKMEIINILGDKIYSIDFRNEKSIKSFDLSFLSNGLYYLKLIDHENIYLNKIIIK